ncbi:MAG: Hsp20/alpha crystallin family protein [bacterium]|nr:Hsp20/alpha crystallin family protein [bacterium]
MTITRWRPLNTEVMRPWWLENMSPISRMMDDFFASQRSGDMMAWGPNVDIVENTEGFEIHAELPGVKLEDVNITLDNNVLTLSGEKKQEVREEDKGSYCRIERSYGRFERSFSLPNTVKAESVKASFEDGVLRISLPKAEQAKSRTIEIHKK